MSARDQTGPKGARPRAHGPRQMRESRPLDAETVLAARTRELDLIQTLGRRAAEARTPAELFEAAVAVLQRSEEIDAALVVTDLEGRAEALAFLARPLAPDCLSELTRRAGAVLGWSDDAAPAWRSSELDSFDPGRGVRRAFRDEDLVVLPILRGAAPVACLLVLPSRPVEEGELRLLYSASNQLSLHLERILSAQEAEADRFRSILESMPQAVLLTDADLRILQANPAAERLFRQAGLPARPDPEQVMERLGLREAVERVRGGGSPGADVESALDDRVLLVTVSPLSAARPGSGGLVLVISDVTDRRRMQRQLAQSERMSSVGQMISGVAHELNNPLASILGHIQLLGAGSTDERLTKRVGVLQQEALRCRRIVQNLLSFARQREPERRPFSLNEAVRTVLALMGYQMRVGGIEVRTDLSTELPSMVGDAHQIQQVLVNLLTNAQHAIRQTGERGLVSLRTWVGEDGSIRLEVRDSGPGIPEAIRHRIFDPFFTTKAEGEGTGLGLSLVYGIVGAHGGTIEALPCGEGGARFVLTFPSPAPPEAAAARESQDADAVACKAARILVVEDEGSLAEMICEALALDGHDTVSAADGREALEKLERQPFDCIISDLRMPGMGGEALYDSLRRSRPDLLSRVLFTSGDTVSAETDRFVARNGLFLLRKPFDLDRLRQVVRERLASFQDP